MSLIANLGNLVKCQEALVHYSLLWSPDRLSASILRSMSGNIYSGRYSGL